MSRRRWVLLALVSFFAAFFVSAAHAQTVDCQAGGDGGRGGNGGVTDGGDAGLALNFASGGTALANGGNGGSARGGNGARGGFGFRPTCSQNTVLGPSVASAVPAPLFVATTPLYGAQSGATYASGASYASGQRLAATGGRIDQELGIAGLMLVFGGSCLLVPLRRRPSRCSFAS